MAVPRTHLYPFSDTARRCKVHAAESSVKMEEKRPTWKLFKEASNATFKEKHNRCLKN